MKKIILSFFAILMCLSAVSAKDTVPELEDAFVIDITKVKNSKAFEDNIVVVDKSTHENINIKVFVYDADNWIEAGAVTLDEFDSLEVVKATRKLKFEGKRFFAIQSNDDNAYVCSVYIQKDDLYVEVRDEGSDLSMAAAPAFPYSENAAFFSRKTISGKFDENLKLRNNTTENKIEFAVYAFDQRSKNWIPYGTAKPANSKTLTKVRTKLNLGGYEYYAIYALNGQEYKYIAVTQNDDLIITISE